MTQVNHALPGSISTMPPRAAGSTRRVLSGIAWRRRYQYSLRVTDTILILTAVLASGYLVTGEALEAQGLRVTFGLVLGCAAGWLGAMYLFRTRDPRLIGVGAAEYKKVLQASMATFGALAVTVVILDIEYFREFLVLTLATGASALVGSRWLWRQWLNQQRRYGHFLSKVVVVGRRRDVDYVAAQLARKSGPVYDVVGAVLECKGNQAAIKVGDKLVPAVCGLGKVEDFVLHTGADAVIVAGHLHKGTTYIRQLGWRLERTATELVLASSLTNVAGPRIRMRPVEGLPLMHVEMPQFTGGRHVAKRAMDICLSAAALIALAPLFLLLAVLIRLDSPGPVFFAQDRAGRGSTLFRMYKFRSMVTSAEADLEKLKQLNEGNGVLFKMKDDPRVTKVGRWIRKYSLDELPQFYNVLKGDMSLVGPRPPLPSEVSSYNGHTYRRLFIKPGLTGLWQISGRSDLDWDESIRLDLYYVENWSVTGDLIVLWRTFKVVLRPVGAY